jgi:hypothetical protein
MSVPLFTDLTTSRSSANATSYATSSITPTAGRLVVAGVHHSAGTTPNTPTLSGNGITWTALDSQLATGGLRRVTVFYGLTGGSPSSGTVTIDFAGQTQTHCDWSVIEIEDSLLTGTNGVDAIVQDIKGESGGGAETYSLTLPGAYGDDDNRALAFFGHNNSVAQFVAGTNYVLLGQSLGGSPNSGIGAEYGRDGDLVVDMALSPSTSVAWAAIAMEIAGASDAPPPSEDIVLRRVRRRGLNGRIN